MLEDGLFAPISRASYFYACTDTHTDRRAKWLSHKSAILHRLPQATCDFEKYEVSEKVMGIHVPPRHTAWSILYRLAPDRRFIITHKTIGGSNA